MQAHNTQPKVDLGATATRTMETRERLFTQLYQELHRVAQSQLRRSGARALSATTVLHETYLSLAQRDANEFANRAQFMCYAARAMRGLIIDYLRSRRALKRGSGFELTLLPTEPGIAVQGDLQAEKLAEALEELVKIDAHLAECVDLRFFCGLSHEEIAELWQVSARTVQRDWDKARFLLSTLMDVSAAPAARTS